MQLVSLMVNHFPADVQHESRRIDNGAQQDTVLKLNRAVTSGNEYQDEQMSYMRKGLPITLLYLYFLNAERLARCFFIIQNNLYVRLLRSKPSNRLTER